ncbi:MAG: TolC family protein [Rhodospirillaceae bacterium]
MTVWSGDVAVAETLPSELRHLLQTHPKLHAARKSVEAAGEGIREAESGYLPRVRLSGDYGPERVDSPSRRAAEGDAFSGTHRSGTLTVTQNLFEGFRTGAATKIAELEQDSSGHDYTIAEQTLLLDGIRVYISVLKQSQLLEIAKRNEQTLLEQLNLESARVERGSGLAVDVLQAKSRLQLSRERVVTIFGELRQALSTYVEVFDRPAVPAQMKTPVPPQTILPQSLEAAVSTALDENIVLKRSRTRIDIASERRTVAGSTYWPRIDLVGEGSWENDVDGVSGIRREGKIVVRAVWDIFDGYLTPARSARAAIEYGSALDTRLAADRDVRDRVRRAWEQYQTVGEQKELLINAVNIAAEVFEARQKLRQGGRESVINLLDAENELNNARLRLSAATFDHILAAYRLLLQIGLLTPDTLGLQN